MATSTSTIVSRDVSKVPFCLCAALLFAINATILLYLLPTLAFVLIAAHILIIWTAFSNSQSHPTQIHYDDNYNKEVLEAWKYCFSPQQELALWNEEEL